MKKIKKYINHLYRKFNKLPSAVGIEACSFCQLNCIDCYMKKDDENCIIGKGYLRNKDFKSFIKKNPYIEKVELSLSGEIFLNPELKDIIKYAYEKEIKLTAFNGVNLNNITDEMIELLVKYKFTGLTVAIDGVSQETYSIYRRNGDFNKVIENVKKINNYKKKYNSKFPILKWQYIIFDYNKHEIEKAYELSKELNMYIYYKNPWKDHQMITKLGKKEKEIITKALSSIYEINDIEIRNIIKKNIRFECLSQWIHPQINWDGMLLGCCCSTHNNLETNVFKTNLKKCLNAPKTKYVKSVLKGEKKGDATIECTKCFFYKYMEHNNKFIKEKNIKFI